MHKRKCKWLVKWPGVFICYASKTNLQIEIAIQRKSTRNRTHSISQCLRSFWTQKKPVLWVIRLFAEQRRLNLTHIWQNNMHFRRRTTAIKSKHVQSFSQEIHSSERRTPPFIHSFRLTYSLLLVHLHMIASDIKTTVFQWPNVQYIKTETSSKFTHLTFTNLCNDLSFYKEMASNT